MTNSSDISRRFWNLPQKGQEEDAREEQFIDDIIQKAHIERLILENLEGIDTVFDGGAGSGRFSILLAERGLRVTHFDISQPMLDKAKERAAQRGVLDRMTFVQGKLEDLSAYEDGVFDLVLSFDAPISYTYPHQEEVIASLARIAKKKVILSVAGQLGWIPYLFNPAQKEQYIIDESSADPFVRWTFDAALPSLADFKPDMRAVRKTYATQTMQDLPDALAAYDAGETAWPHTYAFFPDELEDIMLRCGLTNIRLSGPGALSRSIPREVLLNIMRDDEQKRDFLDFCYTYDSNRFCAGMGKDNLVACADVEKKAEYA